MTFAGDVYSGGSPSTLAASGANNDVTIRGNLDMKGASCPTVTTPPDPVITGTCRPNQTQLPALATTIPTVAVPTTPSNPAKKTLGQCTYFYPGVYTAAQFAFASGKGHYLASGTYYITGGTVSMQGWVRGGQPPSPAAPNDALLNGANPCDPSTTNDAWAAANKPAGVPYTSTGTGVTLILGGTTRLSMIDHASTRVELFPRIPGPGSPDLAATPGVSIWGINTGTTQQLRQAHPGHGLPVPRQGDRRGHPRPDVPAQHHRRRRALQQPGSRLRGPVRRWRRGEPAVDHRRLPQLGGGTGDHCQWRRDRPGDPADAAHAADPAASRHHVHRATPEWHHDDDPGRRRVRRDPDAAPKILSWRKTAAA